MAGARDAVSGMIDLLTARHGMAPEEAYMLCSVCADLRISEIVDQPNWIVSFYFPRLVLDRRIGACVVDRRYEPVRQLIKQFLSKPRYLLPRE